MKQGHTKTLAIMGSAQENPKTEKKKIFKEIKNKIYSAFQKKKCNVKHEDVPEQYISNVNQPPKPTPVTTLLADFERLKFEEAKRKESIKAEIDQDELLNFSYKIVKKEPNNSCSSNDSGFSGQVEKSTDSELFESKESLETTKEDEDGEEVLLEAVKGLEVSQENNSKGKKTLQVFVARGKESQRGFKPQPFTPYQTFSNRQILSGGQVTVNPVQNAYTDINLALSNVDRTVSIHAHTSPDEMLQNFNLAEEYVYKDIQSQQILRELQNSEFNAELSEIFQIINCDLEASRVLEHSPNYKSAYVETESANPIEEFHLSQVPHYSDFDTSLTETLLVLNAETTNAFQEPRQSHDNFLTPPRSNENVFNPDSPANSIGNNKSVYSVHSPLSEYTFSPSDHSLSLSNEQYQDIPVFPDLPESVIESEQNSSSPKERERLKSNTSLNLKQFKDLQNKLSAEFAKHDCCKQDLGLAREVFKERFMKLDEKIRTDLCLRLTALPLKTCYGVLHHILMGFSSECEQDGIMCAVFSLICERVLGGRPQLFVEDFGLNLLKAASLRCPSRPDLTRYVVQSIWVALDTPAVKRLEIKEVVFKETDKLGDTLIGALARRGDSCADVLAEIVRPRSGQPPLFAVGHCNIEGMSALHTACAGHGAARAHRTVHVLLAHAGADIWQGDIKGGDTALHYAVKPGTCDLELVMTLFKHVDRKRWKQLAHAPNRSLVSPIETARAATKSSRHNYPEEVLSFLKKCRT